tara:strand:+ start:45961 stop:46428 length:468 start_codon:yes stop_codon:yes gene_type:complete
MMSRRIAVLALAALSYGCSDDADSTPPLFPDDYQTSYVEVRNCRPSGDHELNNIRILAAPDALVSYRDRNENFSEGAVVLKEEYEFDDRDCLGEVKQWTVMRKLADGTDPSALDWDWQKVDGAGVVVEENTPSCFGCHTGCGSAPDGFDGTCAVP